MRTPDEHIKTLQRRIDFLKSREHKNSFDFAEIGSLEWAIVNLVRQEPPQHALMAEHWKAEYDKLKAQREWVGLTLADKEEFLAQDFGGNRLDAMDWAARKLKEKNT